MKSSCDMANVAAVLGCVASLCNCGAVLEAVGFVRDPNAMLKGVEVM
jgi:hypothetical protein